MGRRWLATLLLCAAIVTAAPQADAAGAPPRIQRTPDFIGRVNAAIDRGVAWLRAQEAAGDLTTQYDRDPGYRYGVAALAVHTLRVCGMAQEDPLIQGWLAKLRACYYDQKEKGVRSTYVVGIMCMAAAEDPPKDPKATAAKLPSRDLDWLTDMARWLEATMGPSNAWRYGNSADYDHSNTQYALLGLRAAADSGVGVSPKTWRKALEHLLDTQQETGPRVERVEPLGKGQTGAQMTDRARGWGYTDARESYGSMTAGCVGSVVLCRSALLGRRALSVNEDLRSERSIRDGIAWLGRHFSVTTNPLERGGDRGWLHYYLYALERAGILADVEWMGLNDWYGEGAEFLLAGQLPGGSWWGDDFASGGLETCYALLFLKRGTVPVTQGALTQASDETDIRFEAAGALGAADFEDFVDLVLSRWRRAPTPDAKERLLSRAVEVGPRLVEPLILRLASPREPVRSAAIALLAHATGFDHGYAAGAERVAREDAIDRWAAWWFENRARLRYDAAAGRIVADAALR